VLPVLPVLSNFLQVEMPPRNRHRYQSVIADALEDGEGVSINHLKYKIMVKAMLGKEIRWKEILTHCCCFSWSQNGLNWMLQQYKHKELRRI